MTRISILKVTNLRIFQTFAGFSGWISFIQQANRMVAAMPTNPMGVVDVRMPLCHV